MNNTDKQYNELCKLILDKGRSKADRTGTGTIGIHGYQMRFDLNEGFPLLTNKKLFTRGIIEELLFFIKGDTHLSYLKDRDVNIWNDWADDNGNLGPIYSHQWRNFGGKHSNRKQPVPKIPEKATKLGVANTEGQKLNEKLYSIWTGMINRCYNKNKSTYKYYGGKGVFVSNDWLTFLNFVDDAKNIEGWNLKCNAWDDYELDKDILGDGFCYSKNTCKWVSQIENMQAKNNKTYTVRHDDGRIISFSSINNFIKEHDLNQGNFCSMLREDRDIANGWHLVEIINHDKGIDQLQEVINSLTSNPNSRRHIINSWHVGDLQFMALPPCHCLFQFHTSELTLDERFKYWFDKNKPNRDVVDHYSSVSIVNQAKILDEHNIPKHQLDLQLYQRSTDCGLGLPFNIASYSTLLLMVAQCVNMIPNEFIWDGGDTHIYMNHINAIKEHISRNPRKLPTMKLNPNVKDIFSFKIEDFTLEGYDPHPAIKMDVSV
jgi:thymidylate synthase